MSDTQRDDEFFAQAVMEHLPDAVWVRDAEDPTRAYQLRRMRAFHTKPANGLRDDMEAHLQFAGREPRGGPM